MHGLRTLPFYIFCLCLILGSFSGAALAAENPLEMQTEDDRLVRWDLSADSVTNLNDAEIVEAKGNVYLRRGNEYLKADFARYYASTKWVYLQGHVIVRMGKDEIKAEEAEFDLRSRVGWLKQGQLFMEGPHAYLSGERIDKHWGDVYTFNQAKVSMCDGDVPAWSITADQAVVEIDGYARLSHSTFQMKDVPVAYAPFFIVPVKTDRQTGLLTPEFGKSSQKGFFYNQPFFWAINESSDLTLNEYFMSKRGFMHGIEYRTHPTADSTGWVRFDWLNDNERNTSDLEGKYTGDGLVRTNSERYWLRGMLDTRFDTPNWRFKADLDYVSDQYYLSEFKQGFSGFSRSRNELFSLFSRDLAERDTNRVSGMLLTHDWERGYVAFSSKYTQDSSLGHGNKPTASDTTLQRLPQFDAFLHKGRIFPDFPLEAQASIQAGYMYRRSGTRGARYEVAPQLLLPLNSRFGSIIARAGLFQNIYATERPSRNDPNYNTAQPREKDTATTTQDFSIAAFTEFSKVYTFDSTLAATKENVGKTEMSGLRHSIQPRVEWIYRPLANQERAPYYDENDRHVPRTELVYSLTNVLTRKRDTVTLAKDDKGNMVPTKKASYTDLLRLRVEQGYDYREANRDSALEDFARRPMTDVLTELTVSPIDYLSVRARGNWSPYENDFTRQTLSMAVTWPTYGSVSVGYDSRSKLEEYTRRQAEDIQFITLGATLGPWGPFYLSGTYFYDYETLKNHEMSLNLTYQHQCFSIMGRMYIEPQEKSYQLLVQLTGLGD